MSNFSIKVTIAGRTYPLVIAREEEEQVRRAAKNIEETVREFQESYAVKDKQDLLAMTALKYATEASEQGAEVELDNYEDRLRSIDERLSNYLNQ